LEDKFTEVLERKGWDSNGAIKAPTPNAKCIAWIYGGLLFPQILTQYALPPNKQNKGNRNQQRHQFNYHDYSIFTLNKIIKQKC
jgi:hypothetical protein